MLIDPSQINMDKHRASSVARGRSTGFAVLDEYMSLKDGYPLFIAGDPYSGKTSFALEMLVTQAEIFGTKSALYLGETGEIEDIIDELCTIYIRKPYKQWKAKDVPNNFAMSEDERYQAEAWVAEHFRIFDPEKDYTFESFYNEVSAYEREFNVRFDFTLFDPVVDIKGFEHNAEYLLNKLKLVRNTSLKNKRIDILVNHIGATDKVRMKDEFKRVKSPALPDEWAGGKAWHRRAFTMILIYRPDIEQNATENETWVIIQKSKPKGIGKIGTAKLYWDWKRNRYYETDPTAGDLYSRKL